MALDKSGDIFAKIYFEVANPASFGSINQLLKAARREEPSIEKGDVKRWLSGQDTYTLHRPVRRNFTRRKTIVQGIDHQWQLDLVDLQSLKGQNNGNKYLLTIIDVFSRHAWAVPLKSKRGDAI